MSKLFRTVLVLSCLAVSGCASMSADECRTADWRAIGYEDGEQGKTVEELSRHRKACARVDITPDLEAYQSGREQGLREFCQPSRGYAAGAKGYNYTGICPNDLEIAFVSAYEDGRVLFNLENEVRKAEKEISSIENELDTLARDVSNAEDQLVHDDTDVQGRKDLLASIKDMNHERDNLLFDLHRWQDELEDRVDDVEDYKRDAPVYYTR